jgi:hypothetical protein
MIEMIVGAIGFRLRGSALFEQWTGRGATTARIVCWAVPMGALSLLTLPWELALLAGAGFWLGAIPGWYGSLGLTGKKDYAIMAVRGVCWTLPAAMAFVNDAPLNAVALLIAGALCPVAYHLGGLIPSKIENLRQGPEVGEVLFGALIGLAIAL